MVPRHADPEPVRNAWHVGLNATAAILRFFSNRQKRLSYPGFYLNGLRRLPAPEPKDFDVRANADSWLQPLPQMRVDSARRALDEAVAAGIPGISADDLAPCRNAIPLEPGVSNEREPLQLRPE